MTKRELVEQIADRTGLSKKDASAFVNAFLATIEDVLRRGGEVTLPGFGRFSVSSRSAREGRNPATGERLHMRASKVPRFTAGATFKRAFSDLPGDPDEDY